MLNTSFWETGVQRQGCAVVNNNNNNGGGDNGNNNNNNHNHNHNNNNNNDDDDDAIAAAALPSSPPQPPSSSPPAVVLQDQLDKSLRVQACWIRLWDRWACEQRNLVLYQLHINHALSLERSKLTFAGGRVVSCRRFKQHHHRQNAAEPTSTVPRHSPNDALVNRYCEPFAVDAQVAATEAPAGGPDARDLRVLSAAMDRLRASGWYYEGPDAQAFASEALANMPAGRFCVRDSRHSEHLFTLDVQTGPRNNGGGGRPAMSVRFTYSDGLFGLDSMPRRADALRVPKFRCPIELIDYYVRLSRIEAARQMLVYPVWVDRTGQFFSWMNLRRPMVKTDPQRFPSLKHLARLLINRHKRLITITPTSLPNELIEYLLQYPYSL